MRLDVLIETTNKLIRVGRPGPQELREMLVVGCKQLRMLVSDPTFFSDLKAAASGSGALEADVTQTLNDLGRFAGFLDVEKRVLLDAGLNEEAVKALLHQAESVRPLAGKSALTDIEGLRIILVKLANEICNLAELSEPSESKQFRALARPVLRRVALTVGGAAVVSANVAAALKLGNVYASTSVALGTGMLKMGLLGS